MAADTKSRYLFCKFVLNKKAMSKFTIGGVSCDAFSGYEPYTNKKDSTCIAGYGPIPVGNYYIVNRETGGLLGGIRDTLKGASEWFALYAIDDVIDDKTFCGEVERGAFRLHPKVGRGISKGCITIKKQSAFNIIRQTLLNAGNFVIPDTKIKTYGTVVVE